MKVTKTKVETTLYDTNGKRVSIVRQEVLEIDTQIFVPKTRQEGLVHKHQVEDYKSDLEDAIKIKENLQKVQGAKKGQKIFFEMADLIMIVEKPDREITSKIPPVGKMNSILEAAMKLDDFFQPGPIKKSKKPRN